MTRVILQGQNIAKSSVDEVIIVDTAIDTRDSLVHAHFPMYNGSLSDGSWRAIPFFHPTHPPYIPLELASGLWARGQLYFMTWGTQNLVGQVGMKAADVLAGRYDKQLDSWAAESVQFAHPWIIALNPEFNGQWSPWYLAPTEFVSVWRHIVDRMNKGGARNISWAWIPNIVSMPGTTVTYAQDKLAAYYPGSDYVDLVGFDGYNWAASHGSPWLSFSQIYEGDGKTIGNTRSVLQQVAPGKGVVIGEFASHTTPGDKAAWIRDALTVIPSKYTEIVAISWYGIGQPGGSPDWTLQQADGTANAWEDSIEEGPYVQGSQFVMPPDLLPMDLPFTRTIMVGDPMDQITILHTAVGTAQKMITDLQAQNRDLQTQLQGQQTLVQVANQAVQTANNAVDAANQAIDKLQARLDTTQQDLDAAETDAAKGRDLVIQLRAVQADLSVWGTTTG